MTSTSDDTMETTMTTTQEDTRPYPRNMGLYTLQAPLPPPGTTMYWVLDIETDGPAWRDHVLAWTLHIGDKQGKHPKVISETFVFLPPPEGGTLPMDEATRVTFWEKKENSDLRKQLLARAKPFHEELDRWLACRKALAALFPEDRYTNELPSDNGLFDWGRVGHLEHTYRREPYPPRHFGADAYAKAQGVTNPAPKYHSVWDPSDPWSFLGLDGLIHPFLRRYHGAAPTHDPSKDTEHMYWLAVYWNFVSRELGQSPTFRAMVTSLLYEKLDSIGPCCVCGKICQDFDRATMCESNGCYAYFCPEHAPPPLSRIPTLCPRCLRVARHCVVCDKEMPEDQVDLHVRCAMCKACYCPGHRPSKGKRKDLCDACASVEAVATLPGQIDPVTQAHKRACGKDEE